MNRLIFLIFLTFCSNDFSFADTNSKSDLPKIENINCNLINWKDLQCAVIMKPSNYIYGIKIRVTDPNKNKSSLLYTFRTEKNKTFYHIDKVDFVIDHNYVDDIYMYGVSNGTIISETFKISLTNIIYIKEKIQVGNRMRYIGIKMEIYPWK